MLENYTTYKAEKYFASKLIPLNALKVKEEAENYFSEHLVALTVGLDCYAKKSWVGVINAVFTNQTMIIDSYVSDAYTAVRYKHTDKLLDILRKGEKALLLNHFWKRLAIVIYQANRTVTNEHNNSTKIQDLFVRIPLKEDGVIAGEFRYLRTTFSTNHFRHNYIHSHTPSFSNPFEWKNVCLGVGPIRNTLLNCSLQSSVDLIELKLFFWELDKVIGIESLSGGPYKHLEDLRDNSTSEIYPIVTMRKVLAKLKPFVKSYLASEKFKPVFKNGCWTIGVPFIDWLAELTDYFFAWEAENKEYCKRNQITQVVREYNIKNNTLVQNLRTRQDQYLSDSIAALGNPVVIKFHGSDFKFKVVNSDEDTTPLRVQLINTNLGTIILYSLLQTLNCLYDTDTKSNNEPTWERLVSSTNQTKNTFDRMPIIM